MKIKHFVRQSLFYALILIPPVWGGNHYAHAEILPEIEAEQLSIRPLQMSKSGRIYRFQIKSGVFPKTGSIILVQSNRKPIMAFRIIQTNEDEQEFIAKRVRRYDTEGELKIGENYESAQKVADLLAPPSIEVKFDLNAKPEMDPIGGVNLHPPSTETEKKLDPNAPPMMGGGSSSAPPAETQSDHSTGGSKELEHYDSDLDTGTTPENLKRNSEGEEDLGPMGERNPGSESGIEEFQVLNPFKHGVGVSIGNYRNMSGFSIPGRSQNGFSAYYNQVTRRGIWKNTRHAQDTFAWEAGLTYYSWANLTGGNDGYDVLPIKAEGLYSLYLNDRFAFLGYFGLQYNFIIATDNVDTTISTAQKDAFNSLTGIQANAGIGILINIGPQWYVRGDLGIDRMSIGLAVKW